MAGLLKAAPALGVAGWVGLAACLSALPLAGPAPGGLGLAWLWPTPWRLLLVLLAVVVAGALAALLQGAWLKQRGCGRAEAGRAWLPSLSLWIFPLLLFTPLWRLSPGPLAVLRLLAPFAGLLALGSLFWLTRSFRAPAAREPRPAPRPLLAWLLPTLVFTLALLIAAVVGHLANPSGQARPLSAPETANLLSAHSLAVDKTLDLTQAMLLRENYVFQGPTLLDEGLSSRGRDGAWRSRGQPGLPLLMAPFHAWALNLGRPPRAADALVPWLLYAWAALETFLLARALTGLTWAGLTAALALALTLPGLAGANLFLPHAAGAALLAALTRRLLDGSAQRPPGALAAGCLAALLPWFDKGFTPLALLLLLLYLRARPWGSSQALAVFCAPLLFSAGLVASLSWLANDPLWTAVSGGQWAKGLVGQLLDGKRGLLPYGPIWLWGMAGLAWLWRRDRKAAGGCLALAGLFWLSSGLFDANPGGQAWVVVLPVLAAGLAAGVVHGGPLFQTSAFLAGLASLVQAGHFLVTGNQAGGDQTLIFPLFSWLFPDFSATGTTAVRELFKGLVWALPLAAALFFLARPRPARPGGGKRLALVMAAWLAGLAAVAAMADLAGPGLAAYWGRAQQEAAWRGLSHLGPRAFVWPPAPAPASVLTLALPPARFAAGPAVISGGSVLAPALAGRAPVFRGQIPSLPPGRYSLLARLEAAPPPGQISGWLEINAGAKRAPLARRAFSQASPHQPLALSFQLSRPIKMVEFLVRPGGGHDFAIHQMHLIRLLP